MCIGSHRAVLRSEGKPGAEAVGQEADLRLHYTAGHIHDVLAIVMPAEICLYAKPPVEISCDRSVPTLADVHVTLACPRITSKDLGSGCLRKCRDCTRHKHQHYCRY